MVVHVPSSADVGRLVEAIKQDDPVALVVAQQHTNRAGHTAASLESALAEDLTYRQRAVIETAYFGGIFEWARDRSGEDRAASMGDSAPTFHQHIRKAEQKL